MLAVVALVHVVTQHDVESSRNKTHPRAASTRRHPSQLVVDQAGTALPGRSGYALPGRGSCARLCSPGAWLDISLRGGRYSRGGRLYSTAAWLDTARRRSRRCGHVVAVVARRALRDTSRKARGWEHHGSSASSWIGLRMVGSACVRACVRACVCVVCCVLCW